MFVRPRAGLKVRHNVTKRHLPATGAEVQPSSYWARRLRAGDVEIVEAPAEQAPAAEQPADEPAAAEQEENTLEAEQAEE